VRGLNVVLARLEPLSLPPAVFPFGIDSVPDLPPLVRRVARDVQPSRRIQVELSNIFPEWVRALDRGEPLDDQTSVDVTGADQDSVMVSTLERNLSAYPGVLEETGDAVDVVGAMRLAALFDMYLDLRAREAGVEWDDKGDGWKMPEWVAPVAVGAVGVLASVISAWKPSTRHMGTHELAEAIREAEG